MSRQMSGPPLREHGAHAVQFYDRDDALSRCVGDHFIQALGAGGSAVGVVTPEHRIAFDAELAGRGVGVSAARAAGRLLTVDAAGFVQSFMTGGRLDFGRFHTVAGGLIGRAGRAGMPVHVYGEAVVVLWEAGHVGLALELERFWNQEASRSAFSLLCAYPGTLMTGEGNRAALEEVCHLHTVVAGDVAGSQPGPVSPVHDADDVNAERSFPEVVDSVREARHFVLGVLEPCYDGETADDAAMVITELAANAVLHACSGFTVAVDGSAAAVRISVRDRAPLDGDRSLPIRRGHGLDVVTKLAGRWAVEPLPDGKEIWAELPAVPRKKAR